MSKLSQIPHSAVRSTIGNMSFGAGAIAIGATPAALTSTTAIVTMIDGIKRSVAAFTNQALISGGDPLRVQPALTTVYYTVAANAANQVRVFQGRYIGEPFNNSVGVSAVGDGYVPDVPDGFAPLAVLKITTGAATSFIPGTTALNAALVVTTITEVGMLGSIDRP